jgi:hypothetical protein
MSTATRTMPQPLRMGPIAAALAVVTLIAAAGVSASLGAFNGAGAKAIPATAPKSLNVDRDINSYGAPAATTPHSTNVDRDGASSDVKVAPYRGHFTGSSRGVEVFGTPKQVPAR